MERREFLWRMTLGLAGGWAIYRWGWPSLAQAAPSPLHLALLADAHLKNGDVRLAEAQSLARAVAEIKRLRPAPDLVLFAGDLAHEGDPQALALGKEILSDLPAPLAAVMGEGDATRRGLATWPHLFAETRYSRPYPGFHLLGLHTSLTASAQGQVFELGKEQCGWLARELARFDPAKPLVVLSHAPLREIFRPWGQWTKDGPQVTSLLSRFSQVYCFHGHIHRHEDFGENPATRPGIKTSLSLAGEDWGNGESFTPTLTLPPPGGGDKKGAGSPTIFHQGLQATAWPLPFPLQGTPTAPRPGLGPQGCGWAMVSLEDKSLNYQPQVWQA